MPYPVFPSQPPAIIENLPSEESPQLDVMTTKQRDTQSKTVVTTISRIPPLKKDICKRECLHPTSYQDFTQKSENASATSSAEMLGNSIELGERNVNIEVKGSFAEGLTMRAFSESVDSEASSISFSTIPRKQENIPEFAPETSARSKFYHLPAQEIATENQAREKTSPSISQGVEIPIPPLSPPQPEKGEEINTPVDKPSQPEKGEGINAPMDKPSQPEKGEGINAPVDKPSQPQKGEEIPPFEDKPSQTGEETPKPADKPSSSDDKSQDKSPQDKSKSKTGDKERKPKPKTTPADIIEVKGDRQEFDNNRQIVTAVGKVLIRFRQSVIDADRAVINLMTRQVLAEGDVALKRGSQVVRGQVLEYNLEENRGSLAKANGELNLKTNQRDLTVLSPSQLLTGLIVPEPVSDRVARQQAVKGVKSIGGLTVVLGGQGTGQQVTSPRIAGEVTRLRFAAEKLDILPDNTIIATNLRLTNDPFSPPEFEIRAREATIRQIGPLQQEIVTRDPRFVFDQKTKIPIYPNRQVIDGNRRNGPCFGFGYDYTDRGGLYLQCTLEPEIAPNVRFTLIPQYLLQRSINRHQGNPWFADNYGVIGKLDIKTSETSELSARLNVLSLQLNENDFRGSVIFKQLVYNHVLTGQYGYRERVFNGSLGNQTVHTIAGAVLSSPRFVLGASLIQFNYQMSYNFINSETDDYQLLPVMRTNNRISLYRFQGSAAIGRSFTLWEGKPLLRTATEGLRFTPNPVVPAVRIVAGIQGTTNLYSNGMYQNSLVGTIAFQAQFGHFSKNFLDYTAFNISYSQGAFAGLSPFLFDRYVDRKVLGFGFFQQIYGGLRGGIQTSVNLDTTDPISTDYTIEYSRRSYGLILRYNPQKQIGTFTVRISDFNWNGTPEPLPDTSAIGAPQLND